MNALTLIMRACMVAGFVALVIAPSPVRAQCVPHPSRQTTISVMNASIYSIAFYIDGVKRSDVLTGERSIDFVVTPGEHVLLAETTIDDERVFTTRKLVVSGGSMCIWSVTNPARLPAKPRTIFRDALARHGVLSLAIPN